MLNKKGISLPFLFSHLILRVNCTFSYRPLKGLITGNLNFSLKMVMQMKVTLPLKKFSGFQRWRGRGVRRVFVEALQERLGRQQYGYALPYVVARSLGPLVAAPGRVLLSPVVLDFRSRQLLRTELLAGA